MFRTRINYDAAGASQSVTAFYDGHRTTVRWFGNLAVVTNHHRAAAVLAAFWGMAIPDIRSAVETSANGSSYLFA